MSEPASTCPVCQREGIVSTDQDHHSSRGRSEGRFLLARIRFYCDCGYVWMTDGEEAEAQGRFLDRADLR